ncbi:hypothetical protein IAT40_003970 [Kwoniella sp. CBS 6097]
MGFFSSVREGSISLKRYTSRNSTATSSRSRSQSSSAASSANVSRTTTPAPQTRQEKLNALLIQSIQIPPPPSSLGAPTRSESDKSSSIPTPGVETDSNAPKKYRDFLEQAKKGNPSYRSEKLRPMAAFDEKGGYNFFMRRRRVNGHSA